VTTTNAPASFRAAWLLLLAGPVIWAVHFMAVYLVAEAVCSAGDSTAEVLGLPWLSFVTIAVTVAAAVATLVLAVVAWRHWRLRTDDPSGWIAGDERNAGLALGGFLLGLMFTVAILFVGLPAAFLEPC
jgi:hypothetical protein